MSEKKILTSAATPDEVKAEWTRRLIEDDLPQIDGTLTKLNAAGEVKGNCCLGVLCEMAVEAGVAIRESVSEFNGAVIYAPTQEFDLEGDAGRYGRTSDATLPFAVSRWAGLDDTDDPEVEALITYTDYRILENGEEEEFEETEVDTYPLATLNDDHGKTFPELGRLIKDQL